MATPQKMSDEENQMGNGQRSGGGNDDTLTQEQKLALCERANEIYRQQLKYMQEHLASLRSLIQDKENIIENLMLRYDLGIITQDTSRQNGNLEADEIEQNELRRKAEALAQRTILENFELREMVNELRDENFHLRNEIYELVSELSPRYPRPYVLHFVNVTVNAMPSKTCTLVYNPNSSCIQSYIVVMLIVCTPMVFLCGSARQDQPPRAAD